MCVNLIGEGWGGRVSFCMHNHAICCLPIRLTCNQPFLKSPYAQSLILLSSYLLASTFYNSRPCAPIGSIRLFSFGSQSSCLVAWNILIQALSAWRLVLNNATFYCRCCCDVSMTFFVPRQLCPLLTIVSIKYLTHLHTTTIVCILLFC